MLKWRLKFTGPVFQIVNLFNLFFGQNRLLRHFGLPDFVGNIYQIIDKNRSVDFLSDRNSKSQ